MYNPESLAAFVALLEEREAPYYEVEGFLRRWCLQPRTMDGCIYLHHLMGPDDPIHHNHPFVFHSFILSGGYVEKVVDWDIEREAQTSVERSQFHEQGSFHTIRPHQFHYISELLPNTWTMVVTEARLPDWGFLVPGAGYVPHNAYQGMDGEDKVRVRRQFSKNGYDALGTYDHVEEAQ